IQWSRASVACCICLCSLAAFAWAQPNPVPIPFGAYIVKGATCSQSNIRCDTCVAQVREDPTDQKKYCYAVTCDGGATPFKVCPQTTSDTEKCIQGVADATVECTNCRAWKCPGEAQGNPGECFADYTKCNCGMENGLAIGGNPGYKVCGQVPPSP